MRTSNIKNFAQEMLQLFDLKAALASEEHNIAEIVQKLEALNKKYFNGEANITKISNTSINTASLELAVRTSAEPPSPLQLK